MKKNAQSVEAWLEAMIAVARYYRLDFSQENVRATVNWERDSKREELLTDMARQLGMGLRLVEFSADSLNPWRLPLIAVFDNQQIGVITRRDNYDNISVQFSGDEGLETTLNIADIEDKIVELALLRPLSAIPDARVDDYIRPYQANWFWSLSLKDWRRYGDIMLASLVANVLALAAMIFSMQVYDRVVPAQSYPTLWVHRLRGGAAGGLLYGDERRHDHRCAGRDDDPGFAYHRAAVADIRRALALAAGKSGAQRP